MLDHLPGDAQVYLRWQELEAGVANLVQGMTHVAMEYSPRNANPYVAKVDAGTVELVRSTGVEVGSSGDLAQLFEATWDDDQWQMHRAAEVHTCSAYDLVWSLIAERIRGGQTITECEVQTAIMDHFQRHGLTTDHPPIVAVGPHSGNPHYAPDPAADTPHSRGRLRAGRPLGQTRPTASVYSDLTRVGFVGDQVPSRYEDVFQLVAKARDAAIARVRLHSRRASPSVAGKSMPPPRNVIEAGGYGSAFVHRTGHSIGQETHGNGANMDDLETHEERLVLPAPASRSAPASIFPPSSGSAAKSTSSSPTTARFTSPAACKPKSCRSLAGQSMSRGDQPPNPCHRRIETCRIFRFTSRAIL